MAKTYREVLSRASSFRNERTGRVCDPIPVFTAKKLAATRLAAADGPTHPKGR